MKRKDHSLSFPLFVTNSTFLYLLDKICLEITNIWTIYTLFSIKLLLHYMLLSFLSLRIIYQENQNNLFIFANRISHSNKSYYHGLSP